jgi:DNA-binding transcriptional regulator YiaG
MNIKEGITPEFIKSEMERTGLTGQKIAEFTQITKQQISSWSTGKQVMSQAAKVMFYLIFLNREDKGIES